MVHKPTSTTLPLLSRRKVFSFFICLCIATFLWFVNALNRSYTHTVAIPVKYEHLPLGKRTINKLPRYIMADIKTSGAKLLMLLLKKSIAEITIDVHHIAKKNKATSTTALIGNLSKLLNTDVELIKVRPDSLHFTFGKIYTKKVALKPVIQINYNIPTGVFKQVKITPQYITISADSLTLSKIDTLCTEKLVLNTFNQHVEQLINIEIPEDEEDLLTLSQYKAMLHINLDEYAKKTIEIPIQVANTFYKGTVKIFPSTVQVTVHAPYALFDSITPATIKAFIELKKGYSGNEKIPVRISASINDCKITEVLPQKVEYIIRKP